MEFNINNIEVGYIYCSNRRGKMILSPKEYKSRKLSSGIGIVISNNYGVVRIISITPNKLCTLFTGDSCNIDLPGASMAKDETSALRDRNGNGNSNFMSQNSLIKGFSWNLPKLMNKLFKEHKNETDWYLPSYGELNYVRNVKDTILKTMKLVEWTEYPLYKLLDGKSSYIVSSTQSSPSSLYSMDLVSGSSKEVPKLSKVTVIGMKMLK